MSHQHDWRLAGHFDGCHWSESIASCACGATLRQYAERDIAEDPGACVWMDLDAVDCARCRDLVHGAAPDAPTEVVVA